MRIADVSPRVNNPPVRGSNVRTTSLLNRLAERHEVRGFSQARMGTPGGQHGIEHHHAHPLSCALTEAGVRSWVSAPILAGLGLRVTRPRRLGQIVAWADVALVEFPWQFGACRALGADTPLVLASHNVEADKFASYAEALGLSPRRARPWLAAIERMEGAAARGAALILAVSEADRDGMCERYGNDPSRVVVVPNGADVSREPSGGGAALRESLGLARDATVVLFAGSNVPPNRVGLRWVRKTAAACPELTFLAVGPVAEEERTANLICTGPVAAMAPYLDAADVALCPIAHGGGTKIKLLESMGAGIPSVAFRHAAEGIGARDGEHLLVAGEDTASIASAVRAITTDSDLASRLGAGGRDLVAAEFDWDEIASRLEAALAQLVPESSSVQSASASASAAG